jgi:hypothetical protein
VDVCLPLVGGGQIIGSPGADGTAIPSAPDRRNVFSSGTLTFRDCMDRQLVAGNPHPGQANREKLADAWVWEIKPIRGAHGGSGAGRYPP